MNRQRFEAFSDGVFAIVATLLVLDIRVPVLRTMDSPSLWRALFELWPTYLAYVTSFLVVGIYWLNHHSVSHHVRTFDRRLAWQNLLFLMALAFIPFPTAVMAQYGEVPAAVLFYGFVLLLCALFGNAMWLYIIRSGYLDDGITRQDIRRATRTYAAGAVIYVIAIALAFIAPRVSIVLYAVMAGFYLFRGGLEQRGADIAT
ncbi:MAG: DUF1211 domain-containing protein [Candidatus Eremiobacteraeota bacterium]|nr:DUF1211 domain-containing protein [Candidatus Eremiobacteraeota bacterium]